MKYLLNFFKSSWQSLLVIIIVASVILAVKIHLLFLAIPALAVITLLLSSRINRKDKIKKIKSSIEQQWGEEHPKKRDLINIEKLYTEGFYEDFLSTSMPAEQDFQKDGFKIDNITWKDLDMDMVFERVDHTMSLPGQQFLYSLLRTPVFNKEILEKRSNVMTWISDNKNLTHSAQYFLSMLGTGEGMEFLPFLKENYKSDKKRLFFYWMLVFILIPEIVLIFLFPPIDNGPCTSRNAITILKFLGYPSSIYKKASEMAKNYLDKSEKAHLIFINN